MELSELVFLDADVRRSRSKPVLGSGLGSGYGHIRSGSGIGHGYGEGNGDESHGDGSGYGSGHSCATVFDAFHPETVHGFGQSRDGDIPRAGGWLWT